jgi:hypothetical protein
LLDSLLQEAGVKPCLLILLPEIILAERCQERDIQPETTEGFLLTGLENGKKEEQMIRNWLLREVDRLQVDWTLLQADSLGSSDHHFLQPASLSPLLPGCLGHQLLHTEYLGHHGLLSDYLDHHHSGHHGLHPDLGFPGLHVDYLSHHGLLPDCQGSALVYPDYRV